MALINIFPYVDGSGTCNLKLPSKFKIYIYKVLWIVPYEYIINNVNSTY